VGILGKSKSAGQPVPPPAGLSVIAVGMAVIGDIQSNGTVKVEGAVDGNVQSRSQVLVAKGGVVHGDIDAREAVIGGAVHGCIRVLERVEIQSGAVVNGDITTRRISVSEGGSLNGQIRMSESEVQLKSAQQPRNAQQGSGATAMARPSVPVARVAVPPRLPSAGQGH
jgi:cytoskeletal protein CcmA (bactofilin family)